jgi:hypothetical protein
MELTIDSHTWGELSLSIQEIRESIEDKNLYKAVVLLDVLDNEVTNANLID